MQIKLKNFFSSFWGWWLVVLGLALVALVMVAFFMLRPARNYYLTFLRAAGITNQEMMDQVSRGMERMVDRWRNENDITLLFLGVDTSDYRATEPVMTDSMMLLNYNVASKTLATLPLPRDIYLPDLGLKINAIYNQALQAGAVTPEEAVREYIGSRLLDEEIDFVVVFSFEQIVELIDLLDGITVDVERSFTDEMYPRSGVDVAVVRDPELLYETVRFEAGLTKMDGETAMKYMRSRHAVGVEGTDLARTARQQRVLQAIIEKAMQKFFDTRTMLNYPLLGQAYAFYERNYERYLPLSDLIGFLGAVDVLNTGDLRIVNEQLSVYANGNLTGVLEEITPEEQEEAYEGVWVWKVRDWEQLRTEIRSDLGLKNGAS